MNASPFNLRDQPSQARPPTGSIQIGPGKTGRLIVRVPYTRERVAKIKTVEGRQWNPDGKYWTVPHSEDAVTHLLALFGADPVEVDPSLRPVRDTDHRESLPEPEAHQPVATTPQLLDQVRQAIRTRHLSTSTEQAYVSWIKRFIVFHGKRHPAEMGEQEIARFLSSLATECRISASTQNQALNALLFLDHAVLEKTIALVQGVVRAKNPGAYRLSLQKKKSVGFWPV